MTTLPVPTTGGVPEASGSGADGPRFDLPGSDSEGQKEGCEKVDFLFVIDNSGSMLDEQVALITAFPGFIATIEETLSARDYHIMVVSTDAGEGGTLDCQSGICTCLPAPSCCLTTCALESAETCNGLDCEHLELDACLFKYGTGKTFDEEWSSCGIVGDQRYIRSDQPHLAQTFACTAGVGVLGSGDERPVQAALAACSAEQNGAGGCNEGFLREDAILVLVMITDEEDDNDGGGGSPGEPVDWYEALVAAKKGEPKSVVVLALVGDSNLPGGQCVAEQSEAEPAPRLQTLTKMFEHGTLGSVCAGDYASFFTMAVGVIDTACDSFAPEG